MLTLAAVILADILFKWYGYLAGTKKMTTSKVPERVYAKHDGP